MSTPGSDIAADDAPFTGPILRLLTIDNVTALQRLRTLPLQELNMAAIYNDLQDAQTLARIILDAPTPAGDGAIDANLRVQLQNVTLERNAAMERHETTSDQLSQALQALGMGGRAAGSEEGKESLEVFSFDGKDPSKIRSWVSKLRIKFRSQERRFPTEQSQLRYAFSRLSDAAYDQVRSYLDESTGTIYFDTLNEFLDNIKAVYDDPDRARTARKELKKLKMGPQYPTFPLYLAEFRRLVGDLEMNSETQKQQLEDGLTPVLRNAVIFRGGISTLNQLITACRELDAAFRASNDDQGVQSLLRAANAPHRSPQAPRAATQTSQPAQSTPAFSSPAHPTDANSGSYGDVPMNLSASEKQQRRSERMARGECTYCGVLGHFRATCAKRLAKENRDLRGAQASLSTPAPAPTGTVSGNATSPTA
jgi:hypothetical protein